MSILTENFWEQPSIFLQQALRLVEQDPAELVRQIDTAAGFHAYIAVGILANNPEAHQTLQAANGLHERLKERFDRLPTLIRERAWTIIQHATGEQDIQEPPRASENVNWEKNLRDGRKAIAKLQELLTKPIEDSPALKEAIRVTEQEMERYFKPNPGDPAPPRDSARRRKPAKPGNEVNKKEDHKKVEEKQRKVGQTSVVDFS